MNLIVQKYGGSSLATPVLIQRAALRIQKLKSSGKQVVVVASAMGRMTDHLIRLAQKTVSNPLDRELDMLVTAGERISMSLLAMALHDLGVAAISFTGSQSGIITNDDHTKARILEIRPHRIREELSNGKVVIIAGFQGVSQRKEITTLGRGGSDTSAVALAAILEAEYCEILTDVDGIYSADPRIVPNARFIPFLSYEDALEMAHRGAKMHVRSIEVAKQYQVEVRIGSSSGKEGLFTQLGERGMEMEKNRIHAIATREGYSLFRITGELSQILSGFQETKICVHLMSVVADRLAILCERDDIAKLKDFLTTNHHLFEEDKKVATVSAIGDGIARLPALIPEFISIVKRVCGRCRLVTTNASSMTAVVFADEMTPTARALHEALIEKGSPVELPHS